MIPPFQINIGHRRYYRTGVHSTTKAVALAQAKRLRKEGHRAQAVKTNGKWSTYFAANPKRVRAFQRSLPREIQHLVPRGR